VSPSARAEIIELRVICQSSALGLRKNRHCKMSPTLDGKCLDRTCAEKTGQKYTRQHQFFLWLRHRSRTRVYLTLLRPNANDRDVIDVNITPINPDYAYFVQYESIGLPCNLIRATFGACGVNRCTLGEVCQVLSSVSKIFRMHESRNVV